MGCLQIKLNENVYQLFNVPLELLVILELIDVFQNALFKFHHFGKLPLILVYLNASLVSMLIIQQWNAFHNVLLPLIFMHIMIQLLDRYAFYIVHPLITNIQSIGHVWQPVLLLIILGILQIWNVFKIALTIGMPK